MIQLQKVMDEIKEKKKIIPLMGQEAYIMLMHKDGTDASLPLPYRPISLLKGGYKIFGRVMAEKLRKCIPINTDKQGLYQRGM